MASNAMPRRVFKTGFTIDARMTTYNSLKLKNRVNL